MTDDDKHELATAIADVLHDSAHRRGTRVMAESDARLVADRIGPILRQQGWMPPETSAQVSDWAKRLGQIPEHHVTRDVLNAHLSELAAIL